MSDPNFLSALALADLPAGAKAALELGGEPILLYNHDGTVRAVSNICSHAEQPLDCGRIMNGWIACPAHGTRFDLETGEPLNPPATMPIRTFATRIVDGMIEVAV